MNKQIDRENCPTEYVDILETTQKFGGHLFSESADLEFMEYYVLDWKFGTGTVMDMETFEDIHPTIKFLLKRESMKRSQWSRAFPVTSIDLRKTNNTKSQ